MEKSLDWLFNKFIAHKGFWNESAPENSLGAMENAIKKQYAIEMDVRMLADGELAVFHDKELSRLTGQDGYLSNVKSDELKNYFLNGTKFSIPTLKDALEFINGRTPVILDLKNEATNSGAFESKILETIASYTGDIAVMSFNPLTLEWFNKNAPNIPRGLLSTRWTKDLADRPDSFIKRFVTSHNILRKRANPDFLAYNIKQLPTIRTRIFKKILLIGWTVETQEEYLEKIKYVDNIIFEGFEPKI